MDGNMLMSGASALSHNPEEYQNTADVEAAWLTQAVHHCETYMKLIKAIDGKLLRLTPADDQIHEHFISEFPHIDVSNVKEPELKSEDSKAKWREFCNKYDKVVQDFNFGTLMRLDASKEYDEDNTILVTRIQFYAIEIARNRKGHNSHFAKKA